MLKAGSISVNTRLGVVQVVSRESIAKAQSPSIFEKSKSKFAKYNKYAAISNGVGTLVLNSNF